MWHSKQKAKIAGSGMYVPPKVVHNTDLEKLMDTSDEWIQQRSGIEERRMVEGIGTSDLAYEASCAAIKAAGCTAQDIDLIILATLSPDMQFPGSSAVLQHKLGLDTTPAMDLRCQCSGFIYSLNVAKLFIESGQYQRVLVVGAEAHSPVLDYTTRGRDVAVLFGDGAGAVVLEATLEDAGIGSVVLHTQGAHTDRLSIARPGTRDGIWLTQEHIANANIYPNMDGRYVYKHAIERLQQVVHEVLEKEQISLGEIDHFLFHQANIRINEKVAETLGIPSSKLHNNIQKYGNCSAASIPILLDETLRSGAIKKGQKVLMAAFGAGFTWAAAIAHF